MPYASLRDFMDRLETAGRLVRVAAPVSPYLEITEIQTRLLAESGPAALFESVTRDSRGSYPMPVLVNLFGTVERVAWGMDREPHQLREIGETLAFLKQPEPPGGWREALEMLPLLRTVMAMRPRTVAAAPCQEIVLRGSEIDLSTLPVQTCWPGEPAPLITWPLVVTRGPGARREDGFNLGIYRMQVTGRDTTLMRWLKHRGGAQHHQRWRAERAGPLPAAAVIGADPGTILAAVTPVPDTLSEYQFAGLLRGRKVELVDCKTVPLKVPAEAEIVLEGHVSLDEYGDEGPYGDHTGYYNSVERFPVFRLSAITMRDTGPEPCASTRWPWAESPSRTKSCSGVAMTILLAAASAATAAYSSSNQNVTLKAAVTSGGGTVNSGTACAVSTPVLPPTPKSRYRASNSSASR